MLNANLARNSLAFEVETEREGGQKMFVVRTTDGPSQLFGRGGCFNFERGTEFANNF